MHIGFTGTRNGMTPAQREGVEGLLSRLAKDSDSALLIHHGDCVGVDSEVHDIALSLGLRIIIHPPDNPKYRAYKTGASLVHPTLPYLRRNQNIVDISEWLIGIPAEMEEQLRSGTWSTIRRAWDAKINVALLFPDGKWNAVYYKMLGDSYV